MRTLFRQPRIFALMASLGIVSLLAISCGGEGKDKPGPNSGGGGGGTTTESLSVSPTTLSLAAGASGTISITSNVAWTVSAPSGYTATPTSGSNNGSVKVTAGSTAAGGTLTIKGGSKSVSVTLSAPAAAAGRPARRAGKDRARPVHDLCDAQHVPVHAERIRVLPRAVAPPFGRDL